MSDPLIHIVCGGIGAGKTTYSRDLAERLGGVVFSIDEWMVELFGADAPEPLDMAWLAPRIARCERQIWRVAARLTALRMPVILDLGFQAAEHRRRYQALGSAEGCATRIHHLDVAREERWRRVEERNNRRDGTFQLAISRQMFDFMEQRWEPPTPEETVTG